MKTLNTYILYCLYYSILIPFSSILFINLTIAQEYAHVKNIKLQSFANSGYPVYDIIAANNKLFLYSTEGIIYFNPTDNPIVYGFVDFPEHFCKFNPVINGNGGNDANLMTINSENDFLYVTTPNLKIMRINTLNPNNNSEIILGTPADISHFQTLHGYNVIKFDPIHNRLYWLIEGRNNQNETGEFHYRDTYLAIYKVNPTGETATFINSILTIGHEAGQYMETIYDVEFNEMNDYFYVAKKKHLEVWQIDENTNTFSLINPIQTLAGKFGKLLYIHNENQIHKILAFPFRLPFAGSNNEYEPPLEAEIKFYIIDGDNPFQVDSIVAPSKRINDAVYLSGYNDLLLCYSPDEFVQNNIVQENSDIATYHFNGINFSYTGYLISNGFQQYNNSEPLINRPVHMFSNTSTSIITGKTHEIVHIYKDNGSYVFDQLCTGQSNFFSKTVKVLSKDYTIDPTLNGLVVFNESPPNDITYIRIAYPVYNICANAFNGNLYFSNRLSSENCGFYIYNPESEITTHINQNSPNAFTKPIGDLIFNEFTGQYLVSENAQDEINNHVNVKVFDGESNALIDNIDINGQYAKEMFISPVGWLYIMYNMHEGLNPKILILNANDYSGNSIIELDLPGGYTDPFVSYTSEFMYNPVNRSVYITVSPNAAVLEPYNSVTNSMRDFIDLFQGPNGVFVELLADQLVRSFNLSFPGKMICPDAVAQEISANYTGKIFIKTSSLAIYQYDNPAAPLNIPGNPKYNEIIYSAYHDKMFGMRDEIDINTGYPNDREINIYQINTDGTSEQKFHYPGQAAAFFDNPYDTMLYLFVKIDDIKLGDTPAALLQLNPSIPDFLNEIVDVENADFYIDYDHNGDYGFHFYDIIYPYIDRYSNLIYLPNGGHGNVSVVSYKAEEPYCLGSGIKWLSFPRLNRNANEVEAAPDVLERIKVPPDYDNGKMSNMVPNSSNLLFIDYNPIIQEWDFSQGQLSTVHSSLGYKIDYLEPQAQRHIIMEGEVWPADESVTVYPMYENWVGYWLPESQSPFDAIPQSILEELKSIKAQYWSCIKQYSGNTKTTGSLWACACQQGRIEIKYGDMIVLKTSELTGPSYIFQWQRYGQPTNEEPKPETEYYNFTEQSDYTPYFIELDTADLPLEVAAFVNNTCVGASTVLAGDSLILVPGYTEGFYGDVVFEEYFGPVKSQPTMRKEYFVYNQSTGRKEKRTIHSIESQDYFRISFRNNGPEREPESESTWIKCLPNPLKDKMEIRFNSPEEGRVNIELYDLFGRKISYLYDGFNGKGETCIHISLAQTGNGRLTAGVYCLVLKTENSIVETKLIIFDYYFSS